MAHVVRLAAFVFVWLVLGGFAPAAEASVPLAHQCQIGSIAPRYGGDQWFDTCQVAAQYAVDGGLYGSGNGAFADCNVSFEAQGACWMGTRDGRYAWPYGFRSSCPANSSEVGGACVCQTGYAESNGACVVAVGSSAAREYCASMAGTRTDALKVEKSGINSAGMVCELPFFLPPGMQPGEGCVTETGDGISTKNDEGKLIFQGSGTSTAEACTGPLAGDKTNADNSATKDPCPNGYVGTVNGTQVCAKRDTTNGIDWAGTKTTTNADGSKDEVKTETTCTGGRCTTMTTTTTTTTTSSGTSVTTKKDEVTEGAAQLCARDKSNGVCVATGAGGAGDGNGGGSFSGDCLSGFKADGDDPVINAMALEQYKRNCQFFDTNSAESQQYAQDIQKTGDQTGNLTGSSTQDFSNTLDMTDSLGGGACPADQSIDINVGGQSFSFVMAVSRACQGLEWLGIAMVAATAIACAFIVFKD